MPTPQQVAALEARLPKAMQEWAPEFHKPLSGYFRQYIGRLEDGRRWIDVKGASLDTVETLKIDGFNLRQEEWAIYDGGDSVFVARYDPASGTFDQAGPGGEA